jgi:carbonic anhydrase
MGDMMDRRRALTVMGGLMLCPLCAAESFSAETHWSYEGATGPDKWGDLDPASRLCSLGSQQSPLDIGATIKAQLSPLQIAWAKQGDTIVNNGHTIQVNYAPGSTLTVGADEYNLLQFHFHQPSEHTIGGKIFAMEAHFVHRNDAGVFAVVGVLMTTGKPNAAFAKLVATMPTAENAQAKADAGIDPNGLLPAERDYYFYQGSLTTPPCSEVVNWLLLTNPIEVATADMAAFAKLYPINARPVQKSNRRFVLRSG